MGDRARLVGSSRGCAADAGSQPWPQSAGRTPIPARRRPSPLISANEQLRQQRTPHRCHARLDRPRQQVLPAGFVRHLRPQLFATSDRTPNSAGLMFASSDRTRPPRDRTPLTWADVLPLVGANGPKPTTAVTSREHRPPCRSPWCGSKWRTSAVAARERNQTADGKAPSPSETCSGTDAPTWTAGRPVMTAHSSGVQAGPAPGHCPAGFHPATEERPPLQRRSCVCAPVLV